MNAVLSPPAAASSNIAVHPTLLQSASASTPAVPIDWADVLDTLVHPRRFTLGDQEAMHLYDAHAGVLAFEGESLSTWHWGAEGPRVLLVHGWESRTTHWQAWVPALLAGGFRVSALDLPGHGHSSGATTDVVQAGRAVLAFARQLGAVHAVIGHSMGSAASLYAFAHGLKVKASVHLAGPSSLRRVLQYAAHAHDLDEQGTSDLMNAFEQRIGQPLGNMDLAALAPGLQHPGLIVHDPADKEMPVIESRRLAAAWPAARLVEPTGLGHRRVLRDPEVIAQAVLALRPQSTSQ
jgi:pimeloyl-ACP methyl ester carboxylesterase